ncbi:MAG: hypothetical protein O7C56_09665 [Rickettsia endosymbiont of Ixodes persulcatus]|nr:hypothetical protein [Rickettsia endosymbiont of Ixodes persulcatus]
MMVHIHNDNKIINPKSTSELPHKRNNTILKQSRKETAQTIVNIYSTFELGFKHAHTHTHTHTHTKR